MLQTAFGVVFQSWTSQVTDTLPLVLFLSRWSKSNWIYSRASCPASLFTFSGVREHAVQVAITSSLWGRKSLADWTVFWGERCHLWIVSISIVWCCQCFHEHWQPFFRLLWLISFRLSNCCVYFAGEQQSATMQLPIIVSLGYPERHTAHRPLLRQQLTQLKLLPFLANYLPPAVTLKTNIYCRTKRAKVYLERS